jgi:hypothetical protein
MAFVSTRAMSAATSHLLASWRSSSTCCRWGSQCWRPRCAFAHPTGHRDTIHALAVHWCQVFADLPPCDAQSHSAAAEQVSRPPGFANIDVDEFAECVACEPLDEPLVFPVVDEAQTVKASPGDAGPHAASETGSDNPPLETEFKNILVPTGVIDDFILPVAVSSLPVAVNVMTSPGVSASLALAEGTNPKATALDKQFDKFDKQSKAQPKIASSSTSPSTLVKPHLFEGVDYDNFMAYMLFRSPSINEDQVGDSFDALAPSGGVLTLSQARQLEKMYIKTALASKAKKK